MPKPLESRDQLLYAEQPSYGGYAPLNAVEEPNTSQPAPPTGFEPSAQSYGGHEPPSGYVPYEPEPDSPEQRPDALRKKSYMDDEDDDSFRVSNNTSNYATQPSARAPVSASLDDAASRKRANDAATDAAFRAAAEADAAKAKEQTLKPKASGWFSVPSVPFFGGKKDANSLDTPAAKGAEPKVHRANLGESKMSIYYDDKLKKWVNPADPDSNKSKAGPAPPPMRGSTPAGGPPRGLTPSATMPNLSSGPGLGSGSGPPSRVGTPAADNGSGAGTPPPLASGVANLTSGPPSRPSTGQSGGGNDLNDLIGPAAGGGRRTVKGKKGGKGRYIDVMAK